MKRAAIIMTGALLAVLAHAATAMPIKNGSSILAFQLSEGPADLIYPASGGFVSAYQHSDIGAKAEFWHFLAEDYAFNLSGGIGFFQETDEPSPATAPIGATDRKYSQASWQARVGGDRVAHITPRFHIFAGPGIQVWSGEAKFQGGTLATGTEVESGRTTRVAISARIGTHLKMGENFGLFGQLGHYWGYASAKDKYDTSAKAHWWPTGHDGAGGIAFNF